MNTAPRLPSSSVHRSLVLIVAGTLLFGANTYAGWDPYKKLTGHTLHTEIKHKLATTRNSVKKFLKNPVQYTLQLPKQLFLEACAGIGRGVELDLRRQVADSDWKPLPPLLIDAIQGAYAINLQRVCYAEGIHTVRNDAMTIGTTIYFPTTLDLTKRDDLWWMLHELEHTVQFTQASSNSEELCEYTAKAFGNGFQHDHIDMEEAADRKADWVIDYAYAVMTRQVPPPEAYQPRLEMNQIQVFNETDQEVMFHLETPYDSDTRFVLEPFTNTIVTASAEVEGFDVFVENVLPDGEIVTTGYSTEGGTAHHLAFNEEQILDVYPE